MRRVVGVVVGLIAGAISVGVIEGISSVMHPMPEGLDRNDLDAVGEWVMSLPISAYVMILLAHASGAFVAAMVCQLIVRDRWIAAWLGLGAVLLLGGIVNLISIPHPTWVGGVDVLLYLPAAWLGGNPGNEAEKSETSSGHMIHD